MLTLKKIAITGGLCSGKSAVCKIFKDLGAYIVSSDEIVHNLLQYDRILQNKIVTLLGSDVLSDHVLDREKISKIVFSDSDKLYALEQLIHPAVFRMIEEAFKKVENNQEYSFFVAEVPLLFETKSENLFDFVIAVSSEKEICHNRFIQRTHQSIFEFENRMTKQLCVKEKNAKADFVIFNNGTIQDLKTQVTQLSNKLRSI